MNGMNRVFLLGNLGAEPELRFTANGGAVLNFRMVTNEVYFDKENVKKEDTQWHNVVVWGKRGEGLAKILSKGSLVHVEGSLRTSSYEDKDKNKRYKTDISAKEVSVLNFKSNAQDDFNPRPNPKPVSQETFDNLPF